MSTPKDDILEAKKIRAFELARDGILEQFKDYPNGFVNVLLVIQALAFNALTNGQRLTLQESLDNLEVFNARLRRQIESNLSTKH